MIDELPAAEAFCCFVIWHALHNMLNTGMDIRYYLKIFII
ncbi:hypothetical protein BACPEC_00171 [[Bacteroides] pectinophilus ATCC 43243]|uniref:Uncharacterized protein n=1 Tax=[Bacteroides] pectinophilus ATCC 43243 TaxID=483218 RepID=B7ANB8_9FIRM|nr:hypothetical protein BACPEC_00171 [[Bacteroides] pectinophilus ATCC 43243]